MAGTTSCRTLCARSFLLLVSCISGVAAIDSSLVGVIVAGSISFVFLVAIIFSLILSFSWTEWFNNVQRSKGRVRMPKAYWKKKEEAKRRLLLAAASRDAAPHPVNGRPPAQTVDRASLVQGWRQNATQLNNNAYEEKGVTMEIGEEHDEEFRIETELTDNEVLDVGPFKADHANDKAIDGDIYPEPYIYTTVDSVSGQRDTEPGTYTTTTTTTAFGPVFASSESQVVSTNTPRSGEVVTNFEDMLVPL